MEELKITSKAVKSAFLKADQNGKELLSNLFKNQVVLSDNIIDIVTSYETACEKLGISTDLPITPNFPGEFLKHVVAEYKLLIITKALNEGWVPDWSNNEYKWYPWFNITAAGLGISYASYSVSGTYAYVGSRLCFKSKALVEYCAKQFIDLWEDYLLR